MEEDRVVALFVNLFGVGGEDCSSFFFPSFFTVCVCGGGGGGGCSCICLGGRNGL